MNVNFDNLVEDAKKHGGCVVAGVLSFTLDELKALITQYIERDRAAHAQPTPEQIAESVITKLVKAQEPLDAESAKVLYDNLWDLYER